MNNFDATTAYIGSTEIKEARVGSKLVLAPNGDELWYKANTLPSLDLRFAENKSLVDATTGANLVTFTRASSGTYVDSQGVIRTASNDVPRFDHNPSTGESLGLLVEEQRQNLVSNSENLTVAPFGVSNFSITSATTANPAGGATMFKLVASNGQDPSASNNSGLVFGSSVSLANSTVYTQSIFVKAAEFSTVRLRSNATGQIFDFVLGQTPAPSGSITACSSQVFPGGIYRLSWTFTSTTSAPGNRGDHWSIRAASTGDGTSGFFLWGAQLEAGAFPTSYIPTTTSAATRSADVASITGTAFSSWYRQDEGTIYADAFREFAVPLMAFPVIFDARVQPTDIIQLGYLTEALAGQYIINNTVIQSELYPTGFVNVRRRRLASAYGTNNFAICGNGNTPSVDSLGTPPSNIASVFIGSVLGTTQHLNGTIRRLTYFPQRLPNNVLQEITQ